MLATAITYVLNTLTAFIPLVFTTWNVELFEFPKFVLLLAVTLILSTLAIIDNVTRRHNPLSLLWQDASISTKRLHLSVIFFLFTQLVTTLTSVSLHTSLWGYYGRFHQGLLTTLCYTIVYLVATLYLNKKSTQKIINISIGTAVLISVYAIAQHFGIDKNPWSAQLARRLFDPQPLFDAVCVLYQKTSWPKIASFYPSHFCDPFCRAFIYPFALWASCFWLWVGGVHAFDASQL
jgi:hypothetical protein